MSENEESGSPGWSSSLVVQTEEFAKAFVSVTAAATTARSPRPSVVFPSNDDNSNSQLQKLRGQVSRVLKGFSQSPETKSRTYNPEVLTTQKRQWASFQLQSLDHRSFKEPSRLFESMVVVGLHPNCDIQVLRRQLSTRKPEGSGKLLRSLSGRHKTSLETNVEPQILFAYPPEKQLPIKYKDLLSFCFPGGVEVHAVERTPSMSDLNELLFGQEHLRQPDLSFVFRLQVADNSTLYGCCVLVDEMVQRSSRLISMVPDSQPITSSFGRSILTTRRCYCIVSRLPFFELHFGVLNSILTEEKLENLTKQISVLLTTDSETEEVEDNSINKESSQSCSVESASERVVSRSDSLPSDNRVAAGVQTSAACDTCVDDIVTSKQTVEQCVPDALWPLLRYYRSDSSESSSSFQGSPYEDRHFRSDNDEADTEEASSSEQEDFKDHKDILEWAKEHNHGSLQIICQYYQTACPSRGMTLIFHPLEHLLPLEFCRMDVREVHVSDSSVDLKSCRTSLEMVEVHNALVAEEEAAALAVWAISSICGSLRLESVLTLLAGALLEKQIVMVCSNLVRIIIYYCFFILHCSGPLLLNADSHESHGILSASVLSIIPLIRPYQWHSLLMPVLPNNMLDFLDAPVPYIVGVKNKTPEVQSKLTYVVLVDLNKNQVKSPSIPQLPKQKELLALLSTYHSKIVGETYLGRKRPVYECTEVQAEAAKSFLAILRNYLESFCANIRSHTITNVQSNDDKVSLLLKESFIDSFPVRDRSFMKLFVDTQLFSVHTDLVLSVYQKE
ncbi:DENN domain-containing protein [Drosera capensis]